MVEGKGPALFGPAAIQSQEAEPATNHGHTASCWSHDLLVLLLGLSLAGGCEVGNYFAWMVFGWRTRYGSLSRCVGKELKTLGFMVFKVRGKTPNLIAAGLNSEARRQS